MKVIIGCDFAGFELKQEVQRYLSENKKVELIDIGMTSLENDIPYYEIGPNWAVYDRTHGFNEINVKLGYTFKIPNSDQKIQLFGGIQNILNQYQNDFDTGKYRDSGYIYGPAKPRTFFLGIKLGAF